MAKRLTLNLISEFIMSKIRYCLHAVIFAVVVLFCSCVGSHERIQIVILHTNDTHSQVEPSAFNSPKPDMGGYARRMGIIEQIRKTYKNVLLLDAGDYWQGSPYFNFFNGRVEIEGMNRMRYDAATLGNHEFDNGVDTLATVLKGATFPVVCSNYDCSDTPLENIVKPYIIVDCGGVKTGIFGLGVNPEGLVISSNYRGIRYKDPVQTAIEISEKLKNDQHCDLIICLSHLGIIPNQVNDYDVAGATRYVDVIIGGHSHTLLENHSHLNADGRAVTIAQMGKSGFYLGRIDLFLEKK